MTTWWRPDLKRIRAEIAAEAALELEVKAEASDGEGAKQGTKRKRAPHHKGAVRARGEATLELQGVQRLSARSSALYVQGVRWGINLRARSSALYMQGVRWCINLRARSSALSVQGVRWGINLRPRSSAL